MCNSHSHCVEIHSLTHGPATTRRVEFLTHDISVHVPHHVNSKIPWYNLRKAHASLQKNWGQVSSRCAVPGLHQRHLPTCVGPRYSLAQALSVPCCSIRWHRRMIVAVRTRHAPAHRNALAVWLDQTPSGRAHTLDCLSRST